MRSHSGYIRAAVGIDPGGQVCTCKADSIASNLNERASEGISRSDFRADTIRVYFHFAFFLPIVIRATHGVRSYQGFVFLLCK